MSSLGFGGAAGVGRPFTIQDLFAAVSNPSTASSATANVTNQYLDENGESVTIVDVFTLAAPSSVTYDTCNWNQGIWS